MEYKDIKHKLPKNFVSKPGTIILIDDKGEPWYQQNKDGTFSGFDVSLLNGDKLNNQTNEHRVKLWPSKKQK